MAFTSLETIAQKLEESKQMHLEDILKTSGSAAISKNEYGVTVIDKSNAASSLIFKPLVKTKLDNGEILKAIDTEIKELKPAEPPKVLDYVPNTIYQEQVKENARLTTKAASLEDSNKTLNDTLNTLKNRIDTLTNEKLGLEQSNDALGNQLNTLTLTTNDFSNQIQSAVQKSVDESILRASLQSQNIGYKSQIDTLIKQIDSLNSIVDGLQSQLIAAQQSASAGTTGVAVGTSVDPYEGTDVREGGTVWRIINGKKRHYIDYNGARYRGVFTKLRQVTSAQMDKYPTGPDLTLAEETAVPFLYAK